MYTKFLDEPWKIASNPLTRESAVKDLRGKRAASVVSDVVSWAGFTSLSLHR
jgi:hypothetical protein